MVICTIFRISNQRGTQPQMTATVCALLNHCRMSTHKNNHISIAIWRRSGGNDLFASNYQQLNSVCLVYTLLQDQTFMSNQNSHCHFIPRLCEELYSHNLQIMREFSVYETSGFGHALSSLRFSLTLICLHNAETDVFLVWCCIGS